MDMQSFIDYWTGKKIDFDGAYGAQCMDLMHQYLSEMFHLSGDVLRAPTAYDAYKNGDEDFVRVPVSELQKGDLVFWNDTYVEGTGHVAVFLEAGNSGFNSFDQNWPINSACHTQWHTLSGVAGGLRHKSLINNNEEEMTQEERTMLYELNEKMTKLESAMDGFRMVEGSGKIVYNAKKDEKYNAKELEGKVDAGVRAIAAVLNVVGKPLLTKEQAKEQKWVDLISSRDAMDEIEKLNKKIDG